MGSQVLVIASILGVINLVSCLSVPFIKPCNAGDEKCAIDNSLVAIPKFADGLPEYGVEALDPIFFDKVDASSSNLKFILNDVTLSGLKSCKANKVKHNTGKLNIQLQLECDVKLDGDYEMSGQILLLNIAGKGKIYVLLRKLVLDLDMDTAEKIKDGEKYYRIKKFTHSFDLKDKSDLTFEGLFQENDVLSKAVNDLIKNNSNDVVKEIGGNMFKAAITKVVENLNNFFAKVPIKDLTIH